MIEKSFKSLQVGNHDAHSLTIDLYQNGIQRYKNNKHITYMDNPELFCFLYGLEISDDYFDDSFSFLNEFFNENLELKSNKKKNDVDDYEDDAED